MRRIAPLLLVAALAGLVSCSGDDDAASTTSAPATTTTPLSTGLTTTVAPATSVATTTPAGTGTTPVTRSTAVTTSTATSTVAAAAPLDLTKLPPAGNGDTLFSLRSGTGASDLTPCASVSAAEDCVGPQIAVGADGTLAVLDDAGAKLLVRTADGRVSPAKIAMKPGPIEDGGEYVRGFFVGPQDVAYYGVAHLTAQGEEGEVRATTLSGKTLLAAPATFGEGVASPGDSGVVNGNGTPFGSGDLLARYVGPDGTPLADSGLQYPDLYLTPKVAPGAQPTGSETTFEIVRGSGAAERRWVLQAPSLVVDSDPWLLAPLSDGGVAGVVTLLDPDEVPQRAVVVLPANGAPRAFLVAPDGDIALGTDAAYALETTEVGVDVVRYPYA